MWKWLAVFPSIVFGQMLSQADAITQKYHLEVAKAPPPSLLPQPIECLKTASVWFSIDLDHIKQEAFTTLADENLWSYLKEIGVQGVYLKNLKQGGQFRTGIGIDPKWGDWTDFALTLQKKGIILIGDNLGSATGLSPDFSLALQNSPDYAGLYHLVEIDQKDWKVLPNVANAPFANVPWLSLQELQKKGYVPEKFAPYVKESSWNATAPIRCQDGKTRRYIYLKEGKDDPVINWLSSSFAGYRIATADTLDSFYHLGQKITQIDNLASQEMLALWNRKLGGFSTFVTKGGLKVWKKAATDLIVDHLTPSALLHAFIAEDAEVLKLMYRLFLEEKIDTKRLIHNLQPFNQYTCDYAEFLAEPKRKFQYYEEILTGEALRKKLLITDAAKIQGPDPVTWPHLCLSKWKGNRNEMMNTHLLLALFYAMQPGAFSFSVSDLLGLRTEETTDILSPNENAIYGSLTSQMKNSKSFAMQLRKLISIRSDSDIANAELLAVPDTKQKGLFVLIHKMRNSNMLQMLAINFANTEVSQTFELPSLRQTTAINLMTGLAEKKPLDSSIFRLHLPPLSGKAILFQTKYFD